MYGNPALSCRGTNNDEQAGNVPAKGSGNAACEKGIRCTSKGFGDCEGSSFEIMTQCYRVWRRIKYSSL